VAAKAIEGVVFGSSSLGRHDFAEVVANGKKNPVVLTAVTPGSPKAEQTGSTLLVVDLARGVPPGSRNNNGWRRIKKPTLLFFWAPEMGQSDSNQYNKKKQQTKNCLGRLFVYPSP
jgi:hypothetical protein